MEHLRILVVDDEAGMRHGVLRALRNFQVEVSDVNEIVSFEFDDAETGEIALEKIAAQMPDILLLDHKLPGLQGLEVLEKLHEDKLDILTIMVTAYASIETAVSATRRGAYDFLAKPFTPEELKSLISKAAKHLILKHHAKKLAQEKKQMRFQLISVVSHELKAPLAAIEGYLNIMKEPSLLSNQVNYNHIVDRMQFRLVGMRKLIFDLLDLTRIESGQKKRSLSEIDMLEPVRMSIETATPAAKEKQIEINLNAPEKLMMIADTGEIEIIMNNMVSNAVKYNRDGGRVFIDITDMGETVKIAVKDTGIGMTKEEVSHLFGEFVRIKNKKTQNISGSGLGLSILKRLSNLYKGDVTVESEPDVGTTFTAVLKKHTSVENPPDAQQPEEGE